MFTLMLRAIIIYIIVLIALRLMGKRQIGDMQPSELVITLIIADLACIPMSETSIPILYGITPLLTLVVVHFFISVLSQKSLFMRKLFNGKPIIVIDKNGINFKALKALNMTLNDLTEGLRTANCFSFDDVAYAIIETNGNLSVLLKSEVSPVTNQDMKISVDEASLQVILINDGTISKENLKLFNIDEDFINNFLKKQNIQNIKDVLVMSANSSGEVYLQCKNQPRQIISTNLKGENL